MAKIHTLKIFNYRGFEKFEHVFYDSNFICLIGRGDSGKTTILKAISAVLSATWNYIFYDTDFHNGNIELPIEIEASLYELPTELLTDSKYGLYKRGINKEGEIIDDILTEEIDENVDILTIKLIVNKDLEPRWYIVNDRSSQDNIEIGAADRAKLNMFLISDYLDRHFCWGKGTPLYSLIKQDKIAIGADEMIADANRKAKDILKQSNPFNSFDSIIKNLKNAATSVGLSINELEALIDYKDVSIKEGNIALHSDGIPYRMNGKGSRRLLSIAIQLELAKQGGIILIDELEQGLEPDRAKFLAKQLKDNNKGQIFITTHSSNVIVELEADNIFLKNSNSKNLISFNDDFQGCLRKNPEVFFAKKVIVCEGATEIGICRALNNFRIKNAQENLAVFGIALADGTGANLIDYSKNFKKAGFDVCVFCDSDDEAINDKKQNLRNKGITIIDCENGKAIEQQLFSDLPWNNVLKLLNYAVSEKSEQSILSATKKSTLDELSKNESLKIRCLLGEKAKEHGWFKRIDHGERIGAVWFSSISDLKEKKLKIQYEELTNWIDS